MHRGKAAMPRGGHSAVGVAIARAKGARFMPREQAEAAISSVHEEPEAKAAEGPC
jgi:hypothetical protein